MSEPDLKYSKEVEHGYNGNPMLPKRGHKVNFTKHMLEEYMKCKKDPVYFAENYFTILSADGDEELIKLFDFQKEAARNYKKSRKMILCTSRQIGKCVTLNTKVKVRNKKTGEVMEISGEEFREILRSEKSNNEKS